MFLQLTNCCPVIFILNNTFIYCLLKKRKTCFPQNLDYTCHPYIIPYKTMFNFPILIYSISQKYPFFNNFMIYFSIFSNDVLRPIFFTQYLHYCNFYLYLLKGDKSTIPKITYHQDREPVHIQMTTVGHMTSYTTIH